jgi:hypothetical protein
VQKLYEPANLFNRGTLQTGYPFRGLVYSIMRGGKERIDYWEAFDLKESPPGPLAPAPLRELARSLAAQYDDDVAVVTAIIAEKLEHLLADYAR